MFMYDAAFKRQIVAFGYLAHSLGADVTNHNCHYVIQMSILVFLG